MPTPAASCSIDIRVRYAEVDAMGYLHHARYFYYFEMGRTELLRSNGIAYADMEKRDLLYVVVKLDCRFRAPARYDDIVSLLTTTQRLTRVRVDHRYELTRDGRLLAEANSTLALIGRDGRPTTLPDDLFERLQ